MVVGDKEGTGSTAELWCGTKVSVLSVVVVVVVVVIKRVSFSSLGSSSSLVEVGGMEGATVDDDATDDNAKGSFVTLDNPSYCRHGRYFSSSNCKYFLFASSLLISLSFIHASYFARFTTSHILGLEPETFPSVLCL